MLKPSKGNRSVEVDRSRRAFRVRPHRPRDGNLVQPNGQVLTRFEAQSAQVFRMQPEAFFQAEFAQPFHLGAEIYAAVPESSGLSDQEERPALSAIGDWGGGLGAGGR